MLARVFQILRRYGVRQPYAVFRAIEQHAIAGHARGIHREEDGLPVSPPDLYGGVRVGGEVDILPPHGLQALPQD